MPSTPEGRAFLDQIEAANAEPLSRTASLYIGNPTAASGELKAVAIRTVGGPVLLRDHAMVEAVVRILRLEAEKLWGPRE